MDLCSVGFSGWLIRTTCLQALKAFSCKDGKKAEIPATGFVVLWVFCIPCTQKRHKTYTIQTHSCIHTHTLFLLFYHAVCNKFTFQTVQAVSRVA